MNGMVRCPSCDMGCRYQLPAGESACSVECAHCGHVFEVSVVIDDGAGASPPPTPPPPAAAAGQPTPPAGGMPPSSSLAIISLILGILSVLFCLGPLTGIPALICGIIAMKRAKSEPARYAGRGLAKAGVVLGAVGIVMVLLAAMMIPALAGARDVARQSVCRSRLKEVGGAIRLYNMDNGGSYPPALASLVEGRYLADDWALSCPSGDNATVSDYIYVPYMMQGQAGRVPMAWDRKDSHRGDGRNVLYTDFTVRWVPEEDMRAEFEQCREGNPQFREYLEKHGMDGAP